MNAFKLDWIAGFARGFLFWAISFGLLLRLFSRGEEIGPIDVVYTFLFHIPLFIGVRFNQFALRKHFDRGKFGVYALMFGIILLGIIPNVYMITFNSLSDWLFSDFYFVAVYSHLEIIGIGFVYLFVTFLLHLAYSWYHQQEEIKKVSELKEQKKTAELQALRAQINPHFLFNTLNTIYGETLRKSDKAPALILQLSDILRYAVDSSREEEVLVSEELDYIRNFVKLQKERFNRPDQIFLDIEGDARKRRIAPLILITFIENCFKHGRLSSDSDFIRISISVNYKRLILKTSNTFKEIDEAEKLFPSTGLANTKRRLELRYPNQYELESAKTENEYQTTLTLNFEDPKSDY